jgi:hypothetical protein
MSGAQWVGIPHFLQDEGGKSGTRRRMEMIGEGHLDQGLVGHVAFVGLDLDGLLARSLGRGLLRSTARREELMIVDL